MFVCKERQIYLIVHVDDVHGTVSAEEFKKLFEELGKHILLTMEPMLVPGREDSFLKRAHAWGSDGLVTVPNKLLLADLKEVLNISTCKPVGTPATKAWTYGNTRRAPPWSCRRQTTASTGRRSENCCSWHKTGRTSKTLRRSVPAI